MPIVCGYCGASMPDISEFCPSCGRPVRERSLFPPEPQRATEENSGATEDAGPPAVVLPPVAWNDRLVGALAYLTLVPAVLLIFLKQYQRRKFVRFHAFQSVFFWSAVIVLLLLGLLASTFGLLFMWLLTGALVLLALFFTWIVLSVKALQGEWFELPVLGALAGQQVGRQ
jgi:uncharacterized membrane protein